MNDPHDEWKKHEKPPQRVGGVYPNWGRLIPWLIFGIASWLVIIWVAMT